MTKAKAPAPPRPTPTVEEYGDWKLVTSGNWQVSIAPDGLMMLPRHLHPRDWDDFVAAGNVATRIGAEMIAANIERAKADDRSIPPSRAVVTEGRPPAGTLPMMVTPGPEQPQATRATIGRARRGQMIPQPPPPQLPGRGR